MPDYTLTVDLTLQGPILTNSSGAGASGISSPFAINAEGHRYLPRTLIKGKLRQAWQELHSAAGSAFAPDIESLLGPAPGDDNNAPSVEPIRGRLHFEDFVDKSSRTSDILYRISIDEERGSVSKGAYQVLEAPYAVGERVAFTGQIHYRTIDQNDSDLIKRYIETGMRWITSFGAERTVGFGRLIDVKVSEVSSAPLAHSPIRDSITGTDKLELKLIPQSPFCLSRRRISNNLFESETVISGAAIKGSLASSWRSLIGLSPNGAVTAAMDNARLELCDYFDKIRITHAFPAPAGQSLRPVTAPLSLVKANEQIYDVALIDGPALVGNPLTAPKFAVDWKSHNYVQNHFGWADPERELRVRTSIDSSRRKAKDEQLFAYDMVVPQGKAWFCQIDLSAVPEEHRVKVESQLRDLLSHDLRGLGKTKSRLKVDIIAQGAASPKHISQSDPRDGVWVVTLQTPALLCDPAKVDEENLHTAYAKVWSQFSEDSLRLKHFYAQQSLAGGFYLYRRFQQSKDYSPWLLTDAGSVFVLESEPDQQSHAQVCIDYWLAHGLPLPAWAEIRYGNHWTSCPFLREGGYGEIAVNLDIHWSRQPKEGEIHVI